MSLLVTTYANAYGLSDAMHLLDRIWQGNAALTHIVYNTYCETCAQAYVNVPTCEYNLVDD